MRIKERREVTSGNTDCKRHKVNREWIGHMCLQVNVAVIQHIFISDIT